MAAQKSRPRLDAIIRHIKAGSYDDDMSQLMGAIKDRQRVRQEAVLGLVHEVFGEEFVVAPNSGGLSAQAGARYREHERAGLDPELAEAERRARLEEERLRAETEGDRGDDEEGADIESRSPIIGSVESQENP